MWLENHFEIPELEDVMQDKIYLFYEKKNPKCPASWIKVYFYFLIPSLLTAGWLLASSALHCQLQNKAKKSTS